MAGFTLCVSCAGLPMKDRAAAIRLQCCPQCQADIGVTSYGVAFRTAPVKARRIITASVVQNVLPGSGLSGLFSALPALGGWVRDTAPPAKAPPPNPGQIAQFAAVPLERHPAVVTADLPAELRSVPEVALTDFPQGVLPLQAKSDIQ